MNALPVIYMRGGTSRALMFHARDLPPATPQDRAAWDAIFCAALGTPDPHGRQLDGMGGGISSLSKVAVIGPPTRPDADVDYTFAQVAVAERVVGYRANCGNISSAVGPFAVDEGLVPATGDRATVRIHNTNTGKLIVAGFGLVDGRAAVAGDFELGGVGPGAPIRLAFQDPGGAATGRLLPTGHVTDRLDLPGCGPVEVSLVDAANPTVFVAAASLGLTGEETPAALDTPDRRATFEDLRVAAAVAMGLATEAEARTTLRNLPLVAIVAPPRAAGVAITTRMISSGQPHRASPLTGAMCLAIAARLPGSVVAAVLREPPGADGDLRIAHASGTVDVAAGVDPGPDGPVAREAVVYRTARRLMDGRVYPRP